MAEAVVGIIGGMGPEATVELMRRVIVATPVNDDADHIRMLVDNNPKVPSRIMALVDGTGENPGPTMASMAKGLEQSGADFLVIPCNTAHYYWAFANDAVRIPILHLVDLVLARIIDDIGTPARVGLLASPALQKVGLYETHCQTLKLSIMYPRQQDALLRVIQAVKAKRVSAKHIAYLNEAAQQLAHAGADAIILGCTEFSLLSNQIEVDLPVFDSLQVLTDDVVTTAKAWPDHV